MTGGRTAGRSSWRSRYQRAGAQPAGRRQVRGGAFLLEQCGGVGGQRRPGDGGHGERGGRGAAARDRRRRGGAARTGGTALTVSTSGPDSRGSSPSSTPDQQRGGADREGESQRVQGAVPDPGQHVAAEGVRAERVGPGRAVGAGPWCPAPAGRGAGRGRRRRAAARRRARGSVVGRAASGRCREGSAPSRRAGPIEQPGREPGRGLRRPPASRTRARVPAWRTGRSWATAACRVSRPSPGMSKICSTATAPPVSPTTNSPMFGSSPGTQRRSACRAMLRPRDSARGGGQRPGLGEGAGQQVVEQPPEQRARRAGRARARAAPSTGARTSRARAASRAARRRRWRARRRSGTRAARRGRRPAAAGGRPASRRRAPSHRVRAHTSAPP